MLQLSNIDSFLDLILFKNEQNKILEVTFDFLESSFDMFNFFIHLLIKSLIILTGKETIIIDEIDSKYIEYIVDRFRYAGINISIKPIAKVRQPLFPTVFIKQIADKTKLEHFTLNINAKQMYEIGFSLCHNTQHTCTGLPILI